MLLLILIDLLIDLFCWLQCFDAVCWATGHLLFKNFCFKAPCKWMGCSPKYHVGMETRPVL